MKVCFRCKKKVNLTIQIAIFQNGVNATYHRLCAECFKITLWTNIQKLMSDTNVE